MVFLINKIKYRTKWIRVFNYHSTPEIHMYQFEEQIKYENYCSVSKQDLWDLLESRWSKDKPSLIVWFDDGLVPSPFWRNMDL